jgi:MFS family permease
MTDTPDAAKPAEPTVKDRRWALIVLVAISTVAFIDRSILNTVGQAIKDDLKITDLQLGLLGGLAFAILYGVLGIPIARLAERKSRVAIISIAVAVWSAMTALSGFASNFTHLLLARIGVGVGEAGAGAPSQSLLSDYYPPEKRASVFSILGLATPLGLVIGGLGGAIVSQQLGWRSAFFVVGLPGLLLAAVAWFTMKEPPRGFSEGRKDLAEAPPMTAVVKRLASSPTFLNTLMAVSVVSLVGFSGMTFLHPFLVRTFAIDYTTAALIFVVVNSISLAGGYLAGGFIVDRLVKRDVRWYGWAPAIAMLLAAPAYVIGFSQAQLPATVIALLFPGLFAGMHYGPTYAVVHNLIEPRMRASAVAIMALVSGLIGMIVGPTVTGALSDHFRDKAFAGGDYETICLAVEKGSALADSCRVASAGGLRMALVIVVTLYAWAALHYWLASRTMKRELGGA